MKWRVNRAVKGSTLPPPSRLLMFVLSDRADARTAVIPAGHNPSLGDLAAETGLGDATVKRHLASLEASGWIARERPTAEQMARHIPGTYRLMIGKEGPDDPSGAQSDPAAGVQSGPPNGPVEGSERAPAGAQSDTPEERSGAQSEPTGGSERSQSGAQSDPPSQLNDRYDLNDQRLAADAADPGPSDALFDLASAGGASKSAKKPRNKRSSGTTKPVDDDPDTAARNKLAVELTQQWWRGCSKEPTGKFVGRQQIVYGLLKAGHEPDDIAEALRRCDYSMTSGSAEFQLKRLTEERERAANVVVPFQRGNGYHPYANPVDQSVYLKGIS